MMDEGLKTITAWTLEQQEYLKKLENAVRISCEYALSANAEVAVLKARLLMIEEELLSRIIGIRN